MGCPIHLLFKGLRKPTAGCVGCQKFYTEQKASGVKEQRARNSSRDSSRDTPRDSLKNNLRVTDTTNITGGRAPILRNNSDSNNTARSKKYDGVEEFSNEYMARTTL